MGIVLLPVYLIMLFGFSYQGVRAGAHAVLASRGRPTAFAVLMTMSVVLAAVEIVLPFAVVASRDVSAGGFAVVVAAGVAIVAGLAGTWFRERYLRSARPIDGLSGAACFLAAAAFPVMWFTLAETLRAWFEVHWMY